MELISDFLVEHDIRGAPQCQIGDRCNLLMTGLSNFQGNFMRASLLSPDGPSSAMVQTCQSFQPQKAMWDNSVLIWDISNCDRVKNMQSLPQNVEFWVFNAEDHWNVQSASDAQYRFDDNTDIIPISPFGEGRLKVLELFSGAYGGWKASFQFLYDHFNIDTQVFGLDNDLHAISTYAAAHKTVLINGMQQLEWNFFDDFSGHAAIHGDVRSLKWIGAVGVWRPQLITISAPCPPWSGAATSGGLNKPTGMLFPESLAVCRILQPHMIAIEQVGGFINHEHKQTVLSLIPWAGFRLVWARTLNLKSHSPVNRIRWLAIAVRTHDYEQPMPSLQLWNSSGDHTPHSFDSILPEDLALDDRLKITEDIRNKADNHLLLPPSKRARVTPEHTFHSRCCDEHDTLPTFMAAYGSQHLIDSELLLSKGLMMHFFKGYGKPARFFHPVEVALLHVVYKVAFIPEDWQLAWKYLGNQIAIPHALITLVNALGFFSQIPKLNIDEVFAKMHEVKLTQSNLSMTKGCMGIVISDGTTNLESYEHDNIQAFHERCGVSMMPPGQYWDTNGFHDLPLPKESPQPEMHHENVTAFEVSDDILSGKIEEHEVPATIPIINLQKGMVKTSYGQLEFWFDSRLRHDEIAEIWPQSLSINTEVLPIGVALILQSDTENTELDFSFSQNLVLQTIFQGQLTLLRKDDESLRFLSENHSNLLYDQFSEADDSMGFVIPMVNIGIPRAWALPFQFGLFQEAWSQCVCSIKCDFQDHFLCVFIQGPYSHRVFLARFWQHVFTDDALATIGYSMYEVTNDQEIKVRFFPRDDHCPIPIVQLRTALFVNSCRLALGQCQAQGHQVYIKCLSRPLWWGHLASHKKVGFLLEVMNAFASLFLNVHCFRLVHEGKAISDEVSMEECHINQRYHAILLHAVPAVHGGGSSTKTNWKTQVKNTLATILLQEGYALDWVSKTIEQLLTVCGIKTLGAITAMNESPERLAELLKLVKSCAIDIPSMQPKQTSAVAFGTKAKKRAVVMPSPMNYKILDGFLLNDDKTQAKQVSEFNNKVSGVFLSSGPDAIPWLRAGDVITSDELGMLVIGELPITTSLITKSITVPCQDEKERKVLLACTLVQFGQKHITCRPPDSHVISKQKTTMVALTLWKEEWLVDWPKIVQNPIAFVKTQFPEEHIVSVWGRSFRNGKTPTTASDSTSVQMHCMIRDDALDQFLGKSGFNCIWATPKTEDGRPSDQWRLLWLPDSIDKAEANVLAAKLTGVTGLVKIKQKFALRIQTAHFESAWKHVSPSLPVPEAIETSKIYKIESLPFGTTKDMLTEWSQHVAWKFKPLRAVGPKTWIVGSPMPCPESQLFFNTMPILIRELPPRFVAKQNPIVAGPRPNGNTVPSASGIYANGLGGSDPWANWSGASTTPANPARTASGPIEDKFAKQTSRLDKLEAELTQIKTDQKAQMDAQKAFQQHVVDRDKENRQELDKKINTMKQEFETSFTKAIATQTKKFDTDLQEIKQLLIGSAKRKDHPENPDNMVP